MANIKNELNNIKNALYGKDVRKSIHDGIDAINKEVEAEINAINKEVEAEINAINKEVENTTNRQTNLENTFDQLVINAGNSNAEIVDARVKSDGTSYSKLGDRLDSVDSQLAHMEYHFEHDEAGKDDIVDTKVINEAIEKAKELNAKVLKFPYNKTFLITPNAGENLKGASNIIIPSNLTIDLNSSTLRIKDNGLTGYRIIEFSENTYNSKLMNGKIEGDRYTHDYSDNSRPTHEFGMGVYMKGKNNEINNLEIFNTTGDCVDFAGYYRYNHVGKALTSNDFSKKYTNSQGIKEDSEYYINSKTLSISDYLTDYERANDYSIGVQILGSTESNYSFSYNKLIEYIFYDDKMNFISIYKKEEMSEIIIPDNAVFIEIQIQTSDLENLTNPIFLCTTKISFNNKMTNCKLHGCRRNGVSISATTQSTIEGCEIHDIHGTSPQAGIDIEDSLEWTRGIVIKNNKIYNTPNASVYIYDGIGHVLDNNYLENGIQTNCAKSCIITNNEMRGAIKIGNQSLVKNDLSNNVFEKNICINDKMMSAWFSNTSAKNCYFDGYYICSYDDYTVVENSIIKDNISSDSTYYCGGNFKNCEFKILYGNRYIRTNSYIYKSSFHNCRIDCNRLESGNGNAIDLFNSEVSANTIDLYTMNIINCDIKNLNYSQSIIVKPLEKCIIENNKLSYSKSGWYNGILVNNTNTETIRNVLIKNNIFETAHTSGFSNGLVVAQSDNLNIYMYENINLSKKCNNANLASNFSNVMIYSRDNFNTISNTSDFIKNSNSFE